MKTQSMVERLGDGIIHLDGDAAKGARSVDFHLATANELDSAVAAIRKNMRKGKSKSAMFHITTGRGDITTKEVLSAARVLGIDVWGFSLDKKLGNAVSVMAMFAYGRCAGERRA